MERVPSTTTHRPPVRSRTSRSLVVTLVAVLTTALAAFVSPVAAKPASSPPGASKAADPARTARVMTRNLYLGAELDAIVAALALPEDDPDKPAAVVGAATATWNQVVQSDPADRMAALADEIVAAEPDAVGLQEVTEWTMSDFNPQNGASSNPTEAYDFLDLLLAELAERGASYRAVPGATATNFTSPAIPIVVSPPFPTKSVKLVDRDVIIVRDGVKATNGRNGTFQTILKPPAFPLPVARGWGSADLRTKLATFRLVNAHTEAFGPEALRQGEVLELFAAQEQNTAQNGALPTVYVGDYNSAAPTAGAYQLLRTRLGDMWLSAVSKPGGSGATCCQDADLGNEVSDLTTRIDLILATAGVTATRADIVGDVPVDLPGDTWWASDHAGVVADLVMPRP